jgi:hypothetical protein
MPKLQAAAIVTAMVAIAVVISIAALVVAR